MPLLSLRAFVACERVKPTYMQFDVESPIPGIEKRLWTVHITLFSRPVPQYT